MWFGIGNTVTSPLAAISLTYLFKSLFSASLHNLCYKIQINTHYSQVSLHQLAGFAWVGHRYAGEAEAGTYRDHRARGGGAAGAPALAAPCPPALRPQPGDRPAEQWLWWHQRDRRWGPAATGRGRAQGRAAEPLPARSPPGFGPRRSRGCFSPTAGSCQAATGYATILRLSVTYHPRWVHRQDRHAACTFCWAGQGHGARGLPTAVATGGVEGR